MYHSITFNNTYNTWSDLKLVPTELPMFNSPAVKSNFIDIPGSDGSIDLTEVIMGRPMYANRSGSFTFKAMYESNWLRWHNLYKRVFDGSVKKAVLEDDPGYYYEGRFQLNEFTSTPERGPSEITVDYNVKPFKYVIPSGATWDGTNFNSGSLGNNLNIIVDEAAIYEVYGIGAWAVPEITSTSAMQLIFSNDKMRVTKSLKVGKNRDPRIMIIPGTNVFILLGSGVVSIKYTEGRL